MYLIAHKVRGEPAFDIAEIIEQGTDSDPGPWYIISTSGHRAYPVAKWLLEDLFDGSDYPHERPAEAIDNLDFSAVKDHYQSVGKPAQSELITTINLEDLNYEHRRDKLS